jgi:hypothetical protein
LPCPLILTIGSVNAENILGIPPNILLEFGETIDCEYCTPAFLRDSLASSTYGIQIVKGMSLNKRALLGGKVISSAQVSLSAQVSGDVLSIKGQEGDVS